MKGYIQISSVELHAVLALFGRQPYGGVEDFGHLAHDYFSRHFRQMSQLNKLTIDRSSSRGIHATQLYTVDSAFVVSGFRSGYDWQFCHDTV